MKVKCNGSINLWMPIGSVRRRGFQPPWYTVYKYECPLCKSQTFVRAGSFRGKNPEPGTGAIRCGRLIEANHATANIHEANVLS